MSGRVGLGRVLPAGLRARLIVTFGSLTLLAVAAFALLVRVSQHSNRKLRDVAEDLSRTGEAKGLQ